MKRYALYVSGLTALYSSASQIRDDATSSASRLQPPVADWTVSKSPTTVIKNELPNGDVLYRIRAAFKLPNGNIAIASGSSKKVYIMDPAGKLVGTAGRSGDGPGEFRSISGALLIDDRTFVVVDPIGKGAHFFSTDGKLIGAISFNGSESVLGTSGVPTFFPGYDGKFLAAVSIREPAFPGLSRPRMSLHLFSTAKAFRLGVFPGQEQYRTKDLKETSFVPLGNSLQMVTSRTNTFVGDTGADSILVFGNDGLFKTVIRPPIKAHKITSAERKQLQDSLLAAIDKSKPNSARTAQLVREVPSPEFTPRFHSMIADEAGLLWLRPNNWPAASTQWLVMNPAGSTVAQVSLPPELSIFHIGSDFIVGVARDEDGLESVRVYGLNRTK